MQGLTTDEKVVVCDMNLSYIDVRWVYTAFSRVTEIKNLVFCFDSASKMTRKFLQSKIKRYKIQDTYAGRAIPDNFIDVDWIEKRLKDYHYKCIYCTVWVHEDNVSINRKDNTLSHVKGNCEITCTRCNRGLSDREPVN